MDQGSYSIYHESSRKIRILFLKSYWHMEGTSEQDTVGRGIKTNNIISESS